MRATPYFYTRGGKGGKKEKKKKKKRVGGADRHGLLAFPFFMKEKKKKGKGKRERGKGGRPDHAFQLLLLKKGREKRKEGKEINSVESPFNSLTWKKKKKDEEGRRREERRCPECLLS